MRWSRLKLRWPFLVWLAACVGLAWLYRNSQATFQVSGIRGVVDAEAVHIASVEVASIREVLVTPGQRVARGEILVEMDTALIARDVTADLLDAITIDTAFGDTHQDILQAISQRLDAIAAIEAELALCHQENERDAAELEAREAEQVRRDALRRDRIIDEITCNELRPALQALRRAVGLYPARIATFEKQFAEAQTAYRQVAAWLGYREGESVSDAISRHLDEGRVAEIIAKVKTEAPLRANAYSLRAPRDAVVADVLHHEGDVVGPEFPIVRLVTPKPSRIKAYLDETQLMAVHAGQQVGIISMYRRNATPVSATVQSIASDVSAAAYVMSSTGQPIPLRARLAVLTVDGPHDLIGGESIYVVLPTRTWLGLLDWLPVQWPRWGGT